MPIECDLFTTISCPLCGEATYAVLMQSRYPEPVDREALVRAFRASGDAQLLDQLVQCNGCRLVYVNPRPQAEFIAHSYEEAVDPTFVAQNQERIRTFTKALRRIVQRLDLDVAGKSLLDVGCAGGAFPKAAHDLGFRVSGIEPSHWLAAHARNEYGLDIRQGLLQPDVFPEDSFDVVSLWDVIEHVPQPTVLLATIRGILRKNGVLLVNYPDFGSIAARMLGKKWPFLLSVHLLYYTRASMTRQLTQAGFQVVSIEPHWQSLQFGYILQRMSPYFGPASILKSVVEKVGLAGLPVTYNVGQTMVIARKAA